MADASAVPGRPWTTRLTGHPAAMSWDRPGRRRTHLEQAVTAAFAKPFVMLDGTLLPIDRIAADRPFYLGTHQKHGMNVQVITDPFGRPIRASPALPGATHDITAARTQRVIGALA